MLNLLISRINLTQKINLHGAQKTNEQSLLIIEAAFASTITASRVIATFQLGLPLKNKIDIFIH